MDRDVAVAIVGAGAGGLALAAFLAREGIPYVILEAAGGIRPVPRGELLQPNGLRVLAELGVLDALRGLGATVLRTIRFYSRDGRPLGVLDYRLLDPPYDYALGSRPHRLRQLLLGRLDATAVWWSARVSGVERDARGWRVAVQTPEGPRHVRCRVLVAADGARSAVRGLLGIRARLRAYPDAYVVTVIPRPRGFPDEVWQYQGGGVLLGVIPVAPQELYLYRYVPARRLEGIRRSGLASLEADLHRMAPAWARGVTLPPGADWAALVPCRVDVETWVVDGAALVGDAAHALNPNAAQGTNQALEDARALAQVLTEALHSGRVAADILRRYERARRPTATHMQRVGEESARLWTSGNPLIDRLTERFIDRLSRDPASARRMLAQVAGLDPRPLTAWERLRLLL